MKSSEAKKELISHMVEQENILMQAKIEGFEYLSESINKLGENMKELLLPLLLHLNHLDI